jgi:hypothetical protein
MLILALLALFAANANRPADIDTTREIATDVPMEAPAKANPAPTRPIKDAGTPSNTAG